MTGAELRVTMFGPLEVTIADRGLGPRDWVAAS